MKISLVALAARFVIYGRGTHGLCSIAGQSLASRNALLLLRYYFTTGTKPIEFLALKREMP